MVVVCRFIRMQIKINTYFSFSESIRCGDTRQVVGETPRADLRAWRVPEGHRTALAGRRGAPRGPLPPGRAALSYKGPVPEHPVPS